MTSEGCTSITPPGRPQRGHGLSNIQVPGRTREGIPCVMHGLDLILNVLVCDKDKTKLSLEVILFGWKKGVSGAGMSSHLLSLTGPQELSC